MNKRASIIFMTVAFLLSSVAAAAVIVPRPQKSSTARVTVGDTTVVVEVVRSREDHASGLSGRPSLAQGEGMLFIFSKPDRYGFWMNEMLFPIDMVWIRDGAVVDISHEVPAPAAGEQPATRTPRLEVDTVLEVPAGFARANGWVSGTLVRQALDGQ